MANEQIEQLKYEAAYYESQLDLQKTEHKMAIKELKYMHDKIIKAYQLYIVKLIDETGYKPTKQNETTALLQALAQEPS